MPSIVYLVNHVNVISWSLIGAKHCANLALGY